MEGRRGSFVLVLSINYLFGRIKFVFPISYEFNFYLVFSTHPVGGSNTPFWDVVRHETHKKKKQKKTSLQLEQWFSYTNLSRVSSLTVLMPKVWDFRH